MSETANAYELGWDDEIEKEGSDFTVLPVGDYDFEILDFERGRHPGSDKLPPCNKAIVSIRIEGEEGVSIIKHNLFLHSITEGMLCSFFTAIGQRQKGEKVKMNWSAVPGAKGRCRVGIKTLPPRNGNETGLTVNEIKKFYEPAAPASFEPGKF